MVKDFLISFSDNFKEKTKNPFLGTYLLVWLIRNWDLIYSLFNFDPKSNRGERIRFVKAYYSDTNFLENLLINIFWSFGLLILTYLLVNISRVIVNLSEKQLTPWIYKITDSKSIVLKEEYDRIRLENDELQTRLDKERESKSKLETRISSLENEISENLKSQVGTQRDADFPISGDDARIEKLIERIKSKGTLEEFKNVCLRIQRGEPIPNSIQATDDFLQLGLISFQGNHGASAKYFKITEDGKKVLNIINLEL